MKIIATSDLHGYLPKVPKCDLFLIAGDICPVYDHSLEFQQLWFSTNFKNWLKEIPAKNVIFIAGNHDLIFEKAKCSSWDSHPFYITTRHYLEDSLIEIGGLKIYGSPWQKRFYDWAFNLDEPELSDKFNKIPKCDILVTHSPAFGCGDLVWDVPEGEVFDKKIHKKINNGCQMINDKCIEHDIKLHVAGHIHTGYGQYKIGNTISANCSYVNERYQPANPIMEFNI